MSVEALRVFEDKTTVGVQLVVNGVAIDTGDFGGEPEDNCESRDYNWVVPMIESAIKAAIAAERERCVKICEDEAHRCSEDFACFTDESIIAADSAMRCAELIRGEG